ncbi:MAG: iron transporter FeoB [Anaerolineales bacterium]|nr:iron transporter FeoB [Anaerolineales bacterium]
MAELRVALAGNPNAGKTTVFNALTGSRQHVGNWPGKTVECKSGSFRHRGHEVEVIDLPGTYSLTAYSTEEVIARDFILWDEPEAVVVVVDACNLERNLYLVVQILELQARLILAVNMIDRAEALGYQVDVDALSAHLGGAPVVPMVATRDEGLEGLKDAIANVAVERARTIELEQI